jgi:hypothetical protein
MILLKANHGTYIQPHYSTARGKSKYGGKYDARRNEKNVSHESFLFKGQNLYFVRRNLQEKTEKEKSKE